VAGTAELPSSAAARVVPGLCRLALEAACMETVRRRRLARGESYGDVERLLGESDGLAALAGLALFDDAKRGKDVLKRLEKEAGSELADTYKRCELAGEVKAAEALDLARLASKLVAWLRGLS
jgi:hypothetical protein